MIIPAKLKLTNKVLYRVAKPIEFESAVVKAKGTLKRYKKIVLEVDAKPTADILVYDIPLGAERVLVSDRKSTRLNSSHIPLSRMPSSA